MLPCPALLGTRPAAGVPRGTRLLPLRGYIPTPRGPGAPARFSVLPRAACSHTHTRRAVLCLSTRVKQGRSDERTREPRDELSRARREAQVPEGPALLRATK